MPLDSTILDAVRSAGAREANWLNMRVALERVARDDPDRSYDAFICAFGFDLVDRSDSERRRDVGGAFAPGMGPWPFASNLRDISETYAKQWLEAAEALEEPLSLARLNDLLWECRTRPRPDVHARLACAAYIELAETAGERSFECMLPLSRALEIARAVKDGDLADRVVDRLVAFTESVLADPDAGPGGAFGALRALVDLAADCAEIDRLLDAATARFGDEPRLFDGISEMRVRRLDREGQLEVRREQVRRWHASSETAVDEPMLRVHRLEQALGVARTHQLNAEANAILVELQDIRPEHVLTESIAVEVDLPDGTMESLVASVVEQPDWQTALREMLRLGVPGGTRADIEQALREQREEFVYLQVFTPVSMGAESAATQFRGSDAESRARLEYAERRAFHARMWSAVVAEVLTAIEKRFGRPDRSELALFFATDVIGPARADRMARALELFWDGEYDDSAHVLVPRIESAIRELARLAGIPIIREPSGIEPGGARSLGVLMPALRGGFPPDWYDYLFNLLIDQLGLNLRNVIAHGLRARIGWEDAALLIHVACFLTRARAGVTESEQG